MTKKSLSMLNGVSVFYPSDKFLDALRENYRVKIDLMDTEENVLWIGTPDFRYTIVAFGSIAILALILMLIVMIPQMYYHIPQYGLKAYLILLLVELFLFFVIMVDAGKYVGVIYVVTSKRVIFTFAEKFKYGLNKWAAVFIKVQKQKYVYFDCGFIRKFRVVTLFKMNVGKIEFGPSMDGGSIGNNGLLFPSKDYILKWNRDNNNAKNISKKQSFSLQVASLSLPGPRTRFTAIHDASAVSTLIEKISDERVNFPEKLLWY